MIKAVADNLVILGITADNVKSLIQKDPIYVPGEELGIDIDIQIVFGTKAIGVEGRKCLVQSFTPGMIEGLKKGGFHKTPKTSYSQYEVLVFYGKTNEDCIKILNEARGGDPLPMDLPSNEALTERMVNGQRIRERHKIPSSILRGGGGLLREL